MQRRSHTWTITSPFTDSSSEDRLKKVIKDQHTSFNFSKLGSFRDAG